MRLPRSVAPAEALSAPGALDLPGILLKNHAC